MLVCDIIGDIDPDHAGDVAKPVGDLGDKAKEDVEKALGGLLGGDKSKSKPTGGG